MAAVEAGFEESLFQALNGINIEKVSVSVEQKDVMRNIVVLKKDCQRFSHVSSGVRDPAREGK